MNEEDSAAILGSFFGSIVAALVFSLAFHACVLALARIPEPPPYEVPYADRVDDKDTSYTEVALDPEDLRVEESIYAAKPILDGPVETWIPPCRSCGPDRIHPEYHGSTSMFYGRPGYWDEEGMFHPWERDEDYRHGY